MATTLYTYLVTFSYEDTKGWAIVQAQSPSQASSVFLSQTQYSGAEVDSIIEESYFGGTVQIVSEGIASE